MLLQIEDAFFYHPCEGTTTLDGQRRGGGGGGGGGGGQGLLPKTKGTRKRFITN